MKSMICSQQGFVVGNVAQHFCSTLVTLLKPGISPEKLGFSRTNRTYTYLGSTPKRVSFFQALKL
ncbi:hypothetical protein FDUTEX481_04362 [Tolypothrix sp. PCC 7601]|nr:hypothetical protein FDUTEX481_04362 [Tolypothrix sp. PCC 7601]